MLNLWAHVIGGFSWKHFQFSVCPSGEARPNSLKLYVLLARPAPDQTCIPGPFSVCPTSGNVKQACPPLHLTERVLPGPPTLSSHTLNDLRTSVLLCFPVSAPDSTSEPFLPLWVACLNGVLFWSHSFSWLAVVASLGHTRGMPHRASPRRVSLKMKTGRSISTKNPSSRLCQRFPRDSLSCTPINLVLKTSKWYRILARYDDCLISCLTFFFPKESHF